MKNLAAYSLVVVASVVGSFSLLLFGLFLLGESFTIVESGYSMPGVLVWNALLCLLFFVQHSVMIRKTFRRRLTTVVPHRLQGVLYTLASGAVLMILVLFWQDSRQTIFSLQGITRWFAYGIFFACLFGMIWGMRALRSVDVLGIRPILDQNDASHEQSISLTTRGPYRWVRHPLYFFTLVMIWCCPDVTVDRLLFNALFTTWIVLGTLLEERDLVAEFGEIYVDYQREVPMLIPYKLFNSND
jgi:protein-S-isoprenylcysteine O-methyltransferase Ste14